MKILIVLSVVVAALLLHSVVVTASNITWGFIGPYDRLLAVDKVVKPSGWFSVQTAQLFYPPQGHISYVTLTAIKVLDWGGRKNFGYARLVQGGPGHRNAIIDFKSQRGKSLNCTVHYFGR